MVTHESGRGEATALKRILKEASGSTPIAASMSQSNCAYAPPRSKTPGAAEEIRVGVISDTHSLLRPQALVALAGSDLILHAGDIGTPEVLAALRAIAPVTAVRGNNDRGAWADDLPETAVVQAGRASLYVLHNVKELSIDPKAAGVAAVIAGHSHRPSVEDRAGVLFVNPGSAGPRRFKLPISIARISVRGAGVTAKIIPLDI